MDLHNVKGIKDTANPPNQDGTVPYIYGTPLRSLVSNNIENLLFAGRLGSFTHVAFGSQRVMATCMAMGQAAGTAAAYSCLHGMSPSALTSSDAAVWSVQQQLLRDDHFVPGVVNRDPRDKALSAVLSATSENTEYNAVAALATSGQTRAVDGPNGCVPGHCLTGVNRWIAAATPASLMLTWNDSEAFEPAEIQLIFDSGQSRFLTFTICDEDLKSAPNGHPMIWGAPQPELVKDYTIDAWVVEEQTWKETIVAVEGNVLRRRVHVVQGLGKVSAVRVNVTATQGGGQIHARVNEVRIYAVGDTGKFPSKPNSMCSNGPMSEWARDGDDGRIALAAVKLESQLQVEATVDASWLSHDDHPWETA